MQQIIDISTPDDGLGDVLRDGFDKTNQNFTELYNSKVDKVTGKGLSKNDFTDADKSKLDGIEPSAQVNVNSDFGETDPDAPGYILNKPPSLYSAVGYFHYSDSATATTPLTIVANTPKKLTNNALGPYTNLDQAPYGIATIWDATNNEFDFSSLSIGDTMQIRIDLLLNTASVNQNYNIYIKLGIGTASEYDLQITNFIVKSVTSNLQLVRDISLSIDNEDWNTAPASIYILSDGGGTAVVNGWYVPIIRKSVNIVDIVDGFKYKGEINLTTPILVNGVGNTGDTYKVVQSGNYDFGAGNIYFYGGDFIFYDGSSYDLLVFNNQLSDVNLGTSVSGYTVKSTPVDTDQVPLIDSADSNKAKKLSWSNIKATLKTYFDTIYQVVLVSGTNIKTINGNSVLGSGDLVISGGATDIPYVVHFSISKSNSFYGANVWQTPDREISSVFNDSTAFGSYYNGTILTDARLGKIKLPFDCQLIDGSFYFNHAGSSYGTENLRILAFDIPAGSVVGTTTVASASYTQATTSSNGNLGSFSTATLLKGTFITYAIQSVVANTFIKQGTITLVFKKI